MTIYGFYVFVGSQYRYNRLDMFQVFDINIKYEGKKIQISFGELNLGNIPGLLANNRA